MKFWRYRVTAPALFAIGFVAFSQPQKVQVSPVAPAPMMVRTSPMSRLETTAIPYDPAELATSEAEQAQTPEQRAEALGLITTAMRLSNVRRYPYMLKTTFTASDSQGSDGTWNLEDTSPAALVYRWTAQGPSFSGTFLYNNHLMASDQPGGDIPLRLAQVRDAMWSVYYPEIGPYASLRLSTGNLAGGEVRCVLVERGVNGRTEFSASRSFAEYEYCVDPKSGLLMGYSRAAGMFVRYDFSAALHFHDTVIIPNGFTIYENGKPVVEAKTVSVGEAPSANDPMFQGAGLRPIGTGQVTDPPVRVFSFINRHDVTDGPAQFVVVDAIVAADGRVTEKEVVSSTDESANAIALAHVEKSGVVQMKTQNPQQPGTTPRAQEMIYTVEITPAQNPCSHPPAMGAFDGAPCAAQPQPQQ
jgi:hypothetical protein